MKDLQLEEVSQTLLRIEALLHRGRDVGVSSNGYVTSEDGSTHYDPVAACEHWAAVAEETQAELERTQAERDGALADGAMDRENTHAVQARLDRAVEALREIVQFGEQFPTAQEGSPMFLLLRDARAALAEIEESG